MKLYIELLKTRYYGNLFLSQSIRSMAGSFVDVSIIWLVYEKTNNPLFLALSIFITQVPSIISSPFIGRLLDKVSPLNLIKRSLYFKVLFMLLLGIISSEINVVTTLILSVLLIMNSALSPVISSGSTVLLKEIVPDSKRHTANALSTVAFDINYILGSSLSGVSLQYLGHQGIFWVSSLLYALSLIFLYGITVEDDLSKVGMQNQSNKLSYRKPLLYIVSHFDILSLVMVGSLWNLLIWGALPIALPLMIKEIFHVGSASYGMLNSVQSIGIILSSIFIGAIKFSEKSYIYTFCLMSIHAFLVGLLAFQTTIEMAFLILGVAGVVSAPIMVYKSTYIQNKIPKNMLGRVLTIISLIETVTYPIGNFLTAFLLSLISNQSISWILFIYSMILLLLVVIVFIINRRFKRVYL